MKRIMTLVVTAAIVATALADTANDLAKFEEAIATNFFISARNMVVDGKVSFSMAVDKYIEAGATIEAKADLLRAMLNVQTNMDAKAKFINSIDWASLTNKAERSYATQILNYPINNWCITNPNESLPILRSIYSKDKLIVAASICRPYMRTFQTASDEVKTFAQEAFDAVKDTVADDPKSTSFEYACMLFYASYIGRRGEGFDQLASMARPNRFTVSELWLYPIINDIKMLEFNKALLRFMMSQEKNATVNKYILQVSKTIDEQLGDKTTTIAAIKHLQDSHQKIQTALYTKDPATLIDVLIEIDTSASAEDINAVIPVLNSFDPDYKSAEVLKALKAINQRYTLKLYDDRDTWEPIISKIRAIIETRQ